MDDHVHIPLENGGHLTWSGKEPPTEAQMKAFNDLADKARQMGDNEINPIEHEQSK